MIRRTSLLSIGWLVFSLCCFHTARAAEPSVSSSGQLDQARPFPADQQPLSVTPFPQEKDILRETPPASSSAEKTPSPTPSPLPPLPPLPPEGQSGFEQLVSGKVEITRAQFETIFRDPNIRFFVTRTTPPPGSILVPVKIVTGPEKTETRRVFQLPEVEAGYLVGHPDRIGESFRLLGIASPYSISTDLKHFGFDLFQQGRSGFQTTNRLPVGPDYILGPGDEVRITVWGKVAGEWNIEIDRDGTVRLPKAGVVALGGLTFEQAREVLRKEFSRYYTGFEMNVTLGALRTMSVYVVGNARQPGAYTVSSLATLVNVLIQAGGPTKAGSLRDIQVRRRGETVARFDLYELLRRGNKSGDQRLLPEDVIFIPPVGPVAAIAGNVNVPALYELKGERTVSQLVELAGGLNTVAFRGRLQIERIVDNNRQIVFESDLEESKGKEVDLYSGDILKVFQVIQDKRTVRIVGAVQRDGEFGFRPGMTVKDLIALSGGTKYYTYLKEAELTRQYVTDQGPRVEKVTVDLESALAGDPGANLPLQENDQLFVRTVPEWKMYSQVTVLGELRFPGTYTVRKGEKLSSLIERAGGFTGNAYPRGAVFTRESVRELQQRQLEESIARLERDLMSQGSARLSAAASPEELKAIEGELRQTKEFLEKLKAVRTTGRMVLDLSPPDTLRKSIYDLELENGDSLLVPENPRSLQTLGAVFNQTAFVFDQSKGLQDYINMAGGYTESADKDKVFILKVNGSAVRPEGSRSFLSFKKTYRTRDGNPLLEPGDSIVVPEKLDRIAWIRETKDITQILFQVAVAAGVVVALF
ncbi:MAG: SLBB domain-containing protein [Deltaproteobacteria bacterium]|nr:SLBB domain-containing protein [Deltaproteobacteria bacterium]